MCLDNSKDLDSIGSYLTSHLKLSGAYWTINGLACLNMLDKVPPEKKREISNFYLNYNF